MMSIPTEYVDPFPRRSTPSLQWHVKVVVLVARNEIARISYAVALSVGLHFIELWVAVFLPSSSASKRPFFFLFL